MLSASLSRILRAATSSEVQHLMKPGNGHSTPEPRYPLALTERQLRALTGFLDAVSTSEADPDAEVFALLDQVRSIRRQVAASTIAPMILIEQDKGSGE